MSVNIFEAASRMKLRFQTQNGKLTIEDLWDLSLEKLNELAKNYRRALREAEDDDFIKPTKKDEQLQLSFDIAKYILDVKIAEQEQRINAAKRNGEKAQLQELIQRRQQAELEALPLEELQKRLSEL